MAFSSDRPGGAGGRDIYLYDRVDRKFLPLPGLNSIAPEQSPSLSADGRYLAFVSERLGGHGEGVARAISWDGARLRHG